MAYRDFSAAEAAGAAPAAIEHLDVVIVGAGLSGIGAAAHLQERCPDKSYAILEARSDLGGTWDLFRYPGIRSDSDMYTLGYRFKPWVSSKSITDGPSIKAYISETAAERGISPRIRYRHRLVRADWSSVDARWTLEVERGETPERVQLSCNVLLFCTGYYSYAEGHRPVWDGEDRFGGQIVHPQFWPENLDYTGKRVVVIGSGATAVTLVPEMASKAAHVVMLQRSPTYIASRPSVDRVAEWLKAKLPARLAYGLTRWKNVLIGQFFYRLARKRPDKVRKALLSMVRTELGPDYDIGKHFTPTYKPWDQRICAVPDGDLFEAIRGGRASVVTDTIESFTADGIRLASGEELAADVVVTATGLKLNLLGHASISVDGMPADLSQAMNYKGCMFSDIPNLVAIFGYTNASWTLKADLVSEYVCRLLKEMDARGTPIVVPQRDTSVAEEPFLDFASGYVQRALSTLPKQGAERPWKLHQNYTFDLVTLRFGRINDNVLIFRCPAPASDAEALLSEPAAKEIMQGVE